MTFRRKSKTWSIVLTLAMLFMLWPGMVYGAAPVISDTFVTAIDDTEAEVYVKPDSDGKAYWAVYPADFDSPTPEQVTSPDTAVVHGISYGLMAGYDQRIDLTGLTASTAYKAYVIAENASAEQSAMATIPFTTSWWTPTYPQAGAAQSAGSQKVEVKLQSRLAGEAYYVVLADGVLAPNYAQIEAGQDGSGNFLAANKKGNISLAADTEASFTTGALGADATVYDIYIVIRDGANYSVVKKINVTTPAAAAATPATITGAVMEAQNNYITVTFSEGVYGDAAHTTGINKDDFDITFAQNGGAVSGASIRWVDKVGTAVSATGGETQVEIKLALLDGPPGGTESITISPKANSIYNSAGVPVAATGNSKTATLNSLTPQSFAPGYPKQGAVQSPGSHAVEVLAKVTQNGVLNYVVLPDNATPPTAQQIKDHADIDGNPVISWAGQLIGSGFELPITESLNLNHDTAYDIYMVAQAGNNNFSAVGKVDVTTPSDVAGGDVCEIGPTGYPSLNTALADVQTGETIKLLQTISHTSPIVIDGKNITFDLSEGSLTIDTSLTSGSSALTVKDCTVTLSGSGFLDVKGNGRGVYADNGTVTVRYAEATGGTAAQAENSGKITVLGDATGYTAGAYAVGAGSTVTVNDDAISTGGGSKAIDVASGGHVQAKSALATGANSYGARAIGMNATINITGAAQGVESGVQAQNSGKITVGGNVTADGGGSTGAWANNGGEVTIDGSITAEIYIKTGTTPKTTADKATLTTKPNYDTYTDGTSTVWVKAVGPGPTGPTAWHTRSPLPSNHILENIQYVNGKYIAVGEKGTLLSSTDGASWTKSNLKTNFDRLGGVAYGGGKYMLVGYVDYITANIYTSTDAVTWSEPVTIPHCWLHDIAYGAGKFVAVGSNQQVLTSIDGVSWTAHTVTYPAGKKTTMQSIVYSDIKGKFVAVGTRSDTGQTYRGNILTSDDGISWTVTYSDTYYSLWDVTYANGSFVAVGGHNDSSPYFLAASGDGETWTKPVANPPYAALRSVEFDGSKFIAAGHTHPSTTGTAFTTTSTNAVTWTDRTHPGMSGFYAAASNGARIVAASGYGNIYTSDDLGTSWDYRTLGTTNTLNDVAWNGSLYVAVGDAGTIQTSSDGQAWTIRASGTTENLNKADYLNGQFIAVGKNGTILTSPDGVNWTKQTTGVTQELKGIAYGDGRYVVVGGDVNYNPVMLYSNNGVAWTNDSTGIIGITFVSVAYGDGVFIAAMKNGQAYRCTFNAGDGSFEKTRVTDLGVSACYPTDIVYAGDKFAAVGGYGEVYLSSDKGASWSRDKTDLDQYYCWGIAYGSNNLVAVGNNGKIMASADDGATWFIQPSGLTLNHYTSSNYIWLRGVAAGNNCFVAVGDNGLVLQSDSFTVSADADLNDVELAERSLYENSIRGSGANQSDSRIVADMNLMTSLDRGTTVTWVSSKPQYIAANGKVTRPAFGTGNQGVYLIATITKGTASATRTFVVTVLEAENTDVADVDAAAAALTFNTIKGTNLNMSNITSSLILSASGINGTTITWASDNAAIRATDGTVTRPAEGAADVAVRLTATIRKGTASRELIFYLTVKAPVNPDVADVTAAKAALTFNTIRAGNSTANNIASNLTLPITGTNGTTITWASDKPETIATNGTVVRPAQGATDVTVNLTATISKGAASDTTSFTLTVKAVPASSTPGGGGGASSNDIIITPEEQETRLNNNQTFELQKDGLHMTIDPDDLPSLAQNNDNIKLDIAAVTDANALNNFYIQYPGQQGIRKGYSVTLTRQGGSGKSETLTELSGEITLSFGLTPEELAGIDPSTLVVYKRAEDGGITEYSAQFDWSASTLSISTSHLCEFFIMGLKGTPTQRLAGADRYATAATVSTQGWRTADTVILTGGADFPDALAGTVLAAVKDAPVLLTDQDSLSSVTLAEIKRLQAKNIFILGGTGIIAKSAEDLLAKDYTVTRIAGASRYETAVRIAELVMKAGQNGTNAAIPVIDTAIVTTDSDYPDALSVASYAGQRGLPILFTEKDALNALTAQALSTCGIKKVILVGGTGVISAQVEDTLRNEMNMDVTRLSGADRYLTGLEIAKYFSGSQAEPYRQAALATGSNFPDALAGAALAAKLKMPVFLTGQQTVNSEIGAYLKGLSLEKMYIFGGKAVLADSVRDQLRP